MLFFFKEENFICSLYNFFFSFGFFLNTKEKKIRFFQDAEHNRVRENKKKTLKMR